MNIQDFEKAHKILLVLKGINLEIEEIKKGAMQVASGKPKCFFELKINDPTLPRKKEEIFDEDGSLKKGDRNTKNDLSAWMQSYTRSMRSLRPYILDDDISDEKEDEKYNFILSATPKPATVLRLFSVLLQEKETEREKYIRKLQKLGLTNFKEYL